MQVPPFSLGQQINDLGVDLEEAVLAVLRSGQYIGGPQIKQFEEAFAVSVGCEHASRLLPNHRRATQHEALE